MCSVCGHARISAASDRKQEVTHHAVVVRLSVVRLGRRGVLAVVQEALELVRLSREELLHEVALFAHTRLA